MDNKETAIQEYFIDVIQKSWTWERLTEEEKQRFLEIDVSRVYGTAAQRVRTFNTVYHAYLLGLGYMPIGWREAAEDIPQF